jgi:signal transduction histidine kinase
VQTLTALLVQTRSFAREQQQNQAVVQQFAYVHASIRDVLNNLRQILSDLRGLPSLDGDLVGAVRDGLLPTFENRTRMTVNLSVGRSWPAALPPETAIHLYRIIQEALTNAYKHGGARTAQVDLRAKANVIVCTVRDDGRGITWLDDSRPVGMGILGMKERAALLGGVLSIRNRRRGGTAVTASFTRDVLLWPPKLEPSAS